MDGDQGADLDPMIGTVISEKFVLRELIGSGGMGKVYRADQLGVGRTVAVKLMHRHLMGDETAGARFTNEARAASQMNHPNSISVLDFGQTRQGFLYIVYEYLRGRSLDALLRTEFPMAFGRVADILCQAMDAVDTAHQLGIIHRDLKPENVFLVQTTGYDFVKVLDFGIAKLQAMRDRSITSPGMVPGTPEYMSPEQARGEQLGPTSDVYSLGVILYELLTAHVPFYGESVVATMMSHVQDPPVPPRQRAPQRDIPPDLERIVLKALNKKAKDRYPTAICFRDALAAWAQGAGVWVKAGEPARGAAAGAVRASPSSATVPTVSTQRSTRAPTAEPGADLGPTLTPLVGRDDEMGRIRAFLEQKGGRALRIHGPVGMGKGRLVLEATRLAATLGLETIHCAPDPEPLPSVLGAARRVALQCLDLPAESVGLETLLLAASRIGLPAEEITGLKELFGIASHLSEMDEASRRRERATAFSCLVRRAAWIRPLLVVCEAFERYDDASRDLIGGLFGQIGDKDPLGILVTHDADLSRSWPEQVDQLRLKAIGPEDSARLVRGLFAEELDADDVVAICQGGKGLPLFIEQLAFARLIDGETDCPEKLADLLAMRTGRLPLAEREVLQCAAVIGDTVSPRSIGRILGREVPRQSLQQLESKGLLEEVTSSSYGFIHPLVTRVVYSSIPAEVRRGIHGKVLEHLRRRDAPEATLAYHSYEADSERAIDELDQAGALALQSLAYGAASRHLSRALEMVRREWGKGRIAEDELEQTAVGVARRLALVLHRGGDGQMARGVLEEALSVAAGVESSRAGLRYDLGKVDLDQGNLQRAMRHLELARMDAQRAGNEFLLGEVLRELARAAGLLGDTARAGDLVLESFAASQRAAGVRGEPDWRTLLALGTVCSQVGLDERARGYLLDAVQEAEAANSVPGKLLVVASTVEIHMAAAEWEEAELRLQQALELVAQVGDRSREAELRIELGRLRRIRGDVERARQELETALRLSRTLGFSEAAGRAGQEIEMLRYARPQAL